MLSYSYEVSDQTRCIITCIISAIKINLVEHKFYNESEEYKDLIDQAIYLLAEAYQVVGKVVDTEEVSL